MAHFMANIKGSRGGTSRLGNKVSGIGGHVRGWDAGVKVVGFVNEDGKDVFRVYATSGSNGGRSDDRLLGTVTEGGMTVGK